MKDSFLRILSKLNEIDSLIDEIRMPSNRISMLGEPLGKIVEEIEKDLLEIKILNENENAEESVEYIYHKVETSIKNTINYKDRKVVPEPKNAAWMKESIKKKIEIPHKIIRERLEEIQTIILKLFPNLNINTPQPQQEEKSKNENEADRINDEKDNNGIISGVKALAEYLHVAIGTANKINKSGIIEKNGGCYWAGNTRKYKKEVIDKMLKENPNVFKKV